MARVLISHHWQFQHVILIAELVTALDAIMSMACLTTETHENNGTIHYSMGCLDHIQRLQSLIYVKDVSFFFSSPGEEVKGGLISPNPQITHTSTFPFTPVYQLLYRHITNSTIVHTVCYLYVRETTISMLQRSFAIHL